MEVGENFHRVGNMHEKGLREGDTGIDLRIRELLGLVVEACCSHRMWQKMRRIRELFFLTQSSLGPN